MKKRNFLIVFFILILVIIVSSIVYINNSNKLELKSIKSKKQLMRIYNSYSSNYYSDNIFMQFITLPFSLGSTSPRYFYQKSSTIYDSSINEATIGIKANNSTKAESSSKDYSTTNIQVENVDEADITKTDGDYIYSLSENDVVITNVQDPKKIEISSVINSTDDSIPEDLILYNNKLVIISSKTNSTIYSSYSSANSTTVRIYNIEDKEKPTLQKSYTLNEPYYTSRCIDNKLYVIASGNMQKENNDIVTYYTEDYNKKEISPKNIKYLKDIKTKKQTLISFVNLDKPTEDVNVSSYLIDISNAYVSKTNIYLLDQKYESNSNTPKISSIFGLKGLFGINSFYDDYSYYSDSGYKSKIYKFNILDDGTIKYDCKNEFKGKTINQYSIDEYNDTLRVALYDNDGSRIIVLNNKLKQIGITPYLAKGEQMYSSRFMGNKAYLVTYRVTDPLYVIDLSDSTNPKVLGELKIPGYSTYLHPYDENHLIGIGMETKEVVNRNSQGKVISTTSRIIGMKMALFDVSNVNNPIQISNTVIGDSRTTSAILTNPKALLFSKEKELIAIPVNNYAEDFEVSNSSDTYSSTINAYTNYSKPYKAEGYFVYNINIKDGFKLKGIVTHESSDNNNSTNYYNNNSKLLRGLYIENDLYTISENAIKVNSLNNLDLISELKINSTSKNRR